MQSELHFSPEKHFLCQLFLFLCFIVVVSVVMIQVFFLVVGTGFSSVLVKNRCVQANLTLGFEVPILLLANILQYLANNGILIMSNACHVRNTENSVGHFEMIHK